MGPKWAPNKWAPFIWGPFGAHLLFGAHLGPILGTRGPHSGLFLMRRYGYSLSLGLEAADAIVDTSVPKYHRHDSSIEMPLGV